MADTEGLRGVYVCDVTPGCREFRSRMSYRDRRRMNAREHGVIGESRVFPAGAEEQFD